MKTPYLDAAIRLHDTAKYKNMASDGAKEALEEFKAIKSALKKVKNIAYEPVLAAVITYIEKTEETLWNEYGGDGDEFSPEKIIKYGPEVYAAINKILNGS